MKCKSCAEDHEVNQMCFGMLPQGRNFIYETGGLVTSLSPQADDVNSKPIKFVVHCIVYTLARLGDESIQFKIFHSFVEQY